MEIPYDLYTLEDKQNFRIYGFLTHVYSKVINKVLK